MQLTRRAEYALRTMVDLAAHLDQQPVMSKDIAKRQDIPLKFLIQIIPDLKSSGLIHTVRGNGGGIYLRRKPQEVTMQEIIEAIEGPIALNHCLLDKENCDRSAHCTLHVAWAKAQQQMLSVLQLTTLSLLSTGQQEDSSVQQLMHPRITNETEVEV